METREVVLKISHGMIRDWWDRCIGRKKRNEAEGRKHDKDMHGNITSLCTCPDAQRRLSGVGVFYVDPVFAGRRGIAAAFAV